MSRLGFAAPESKEAVVWDWVRRQLGSIEHEMRVARVARTLFGLTRKWHGLGAAEARLLALGATVHDVGRVGGERKHGQRGARMICKARWLPLACAERRQLAYLARYHKGRVPEVGADGILERHEDDAWTLRTVLALLRAADSLDSRSLGAPRLAMAARERARGRVLTISGYAEDAEEAETVFGRRKKFRLLEEMLGCRVRTMWYETRAAAMAG